MRFLIAFVAIIGYASASVISPLVYGVNAGDAQAATIDATVAARDQARAWGESNARAAEAAVLYNTEAVRQTAEANRDLRQNAYWGSVAANQNAIAAAQNRAAAWDGAIAARASIAAPLGITAPYGIAAPLGIGAPLGIAAPYGLASPYGIAGLGYRGW